MENERKSNNRKKYNGKYYNYSFPMCLRECLENTKTTQEELANALKKKGLKITRQTISLYAKGDSLPDIETFKKIIEVFEEKKVNYSVEYWLGKEKKINIPTNEIEAKYGLSEKSLKILEFLNTRANGFNELFKSNGIQSFSEVATINQLIEQMAIVNLNRIIYKQSIIGLIDEFISMPEINSEQCIAISSNGNMEIENVNMRKIGKNYLYVGNEAISNFVLSVILDELKKMRNSNKKEGEK